MLGYKCWSGVQVTFLYSTVLILLNEYRYIFQRRQTFSEGNSDKLARDIRNIEKGLFILGLAILGYEPQGRC